ncbi:HisA/HisF-related TIM barrel protein [Sphaerotilaceae bacterium SBD11-9]
MNVIPVIDLLQGQVVRAVRGDRQHYRPIASALCASSEPLTVARTLCEHCAARQLYVADLDALQGGVGHAAVVRQLLEALPGIELWLDAGFADVSQAQALCAGLGPVAERLVPVFGSESLRSRAALEACFKVFRHGILSLDRRHGERLDAAGCWDAPALWPPRVIVMTLERVGAGTGPDLATLAEVAARSPHTRLIGAGGMASEADLVRAQEAGASAWLVASALHDLKLPRRAG